MSLETVRGTTESQLQSNRVLVPCNGEWVGTPSKSDLATSLMQEISKRVIKFVSQSGKSCLQVQGATAKQWSMYNSGFQHTHGHNTYTHKLFSTSCVSFYGCIFMRIEILVSVPEGNDDKYAKVSSFISHGSCSLWQLQIIIHLVGLVAYTSIHASPCH